jgi:transposase
MISYWKIAKIRRFFDSEPNVTHCAKECHVDPKSVRKYVDKNVAPVTKKPRAQPTRTAPLDEFWPEIKALLENDSRLKPYAILEFFVEKYPTKFEHSWRRTLERRIGQWKLERQIEKNVVCSQSHQAGDVLAYDFTEVASLSITIASQSWSGLLFHATLTHSNWEYGELCLSESYEAVVSGVQNAFLTLGGVTRRLRSDSLTAAVNNLNSKHAFQSGYRSFLEHFGVTGHRINVRQPQENGDCESSHGHLKDFLDQALRLRGNRNFESLDQLRTFIDEQLAKRNAKRREAISRERAVLASLPPTLFPTFTQVELQVPTTSVIRLKQNSYSVPSYLIGLKLQSRIHADHIEIWQQGRKLFEMPRLIGKDQVWFDYRHVIDSLVRKPGGFINYRYREHMYPTIWFRKAFDTVVAQQGEHAGIKCYLKLLYLAKHHGQENVETELRQALESAAIIDPKSIESKIDKTSPASLVEDPYVEQPELDTYDDLLKHKEVLNDPNDELSDNRATELATEPRGSGWPFETTAIADDAIVGDQPCGSSGPGALEPSAVFERADDCRNGSTHRESDFEALEAIGPRTQQDLVSDQVVSIPDGSPTSHATATERRVCQAGREPIDVRPTRFRKNVATQCIGRATDSAGPFSDFRTVCSVSSTSVACQTGTSSTELSCEAWSILDVDHRRHRLCTTESRRNGSLVHIDCRSLRTDEYPDQQQPSILQMGANLQGPHDDRSSHRSASPSQHDHRAQCGELSPGRSPSQTESPSGLGITNTTNHRAKILPNPVGKFSCR